MSRPIALGAALAALLAAAPAAAGMWFDIGGGQPVVVYADYTLGSYEAYAPFPFGPFPLGSLVYEDIAVAPCESLGESAQICGETLFIRGFHCEFYGVSCGCQGSLVVPTQLRFSYDPLAVLAAGAEEANLKLMFRDEDITSWTLMPDAVLDTQAHAFTAPWKRNVLGIREYAILTQDITPVSADTWGRVKIRYRR